MEYLQPNKTLQYGGSHILFLDKIILCKQLPTYRQKINQEEYDTKYDTVQAVLSHTVFFCVHQARADV